jgi:hypothetical protein
MDSVGLLARIAAAGDYVPIGSDGRVLVSLENETQHSAGPTSTGHSTALHALLTDATRKLLRSHRKQSVVFHSHACVHNTGPLDSALSFFLRDLQVTDACRLLAAFCHTASSAQYGQWWKLYASSEGVFASASVALFPLVDEKTTRFLIFQYLVSGLNAAERAECQLRAEHAVSSGELLFCAAVSCLVVDSICVRVCVHA